MSPLEINLIFTSDDSTLHFCATELNYYLKKIDFTTSIFFNANTQNAFPIYLSTQDACAHTLDDSYQIHCTTKSIHLLGSNKRSVLLATYKLLYLLGCRFLQPGKQYEYIPQKDLSSFLPCYIHNQTYTASLRHRGVCIEGANALENVLDFIDWLPKLGYNSFFMQFKLPYAFFERWYKHTFNPLLSSQDLTEKQLESFLETIESELKKRDLLYHKVGHGWTCEPLGLKDFGWQKVDVTLEDNKKDWLALIKGKRAFWHGIPTNTNLCYSNSDVQQAFINNIVDYAAKNPSIDYLHVWLADEYNNVCECAKCQDTLLSDQYIAMLNTLDEALTEAGLSTKIVFLLYQELLWPPLHEVFHNHDRFTLMFAPISRTFEKSYEDCSIPDTIPAYKRNQITLPQSLEENLAFLQKWQTKWDSDSFVYDYPLGRAHYGDLGYINISKIISQDIKTLKTLHLNGYISCQELRVAMPHSLPNYIMGLTLFDTDTDFNTIATDYFYHLYGKDGAYYQDYFTTISNLFSCDYFNGKGPRISTTIAANCLKAIEHTKAFTIHTAEETHPYCTNKLRFHINYVHLLATALYHLSLGEVEKAQTAYTHFITYIQTNEPFFQDALDVYRVIEVSSKYTGFTLPNNYSI